MKKRLRRSVPFSEVKPLQSSGGVCEAPCPHFTKGGVDKINKKYSIYSNSRVLEIAYGHILSSSRFDWCQRLYIV